MLEIFIELPDTIPLGVDELPIQLIVRNKSNLDYKVSSLKHWVNIALMLENEEEILQGIKVKPIMSQREDYIQSKGNSIIKEQFDYNLVKIYGKLKKGKYKMTVKFKGNIIDENNVKDNGLDLIAIKKFEVI